MKNTAVTSFLIGEYGSCIEFTPKYDAIFPDLINVLTYEHLMEGCTYLQVHMIFVKNLVQFDNLRVVGIIYKEAYAIHFTITINLYVDVLIRIIYNNVYLTLLLISDMGTV